MQVGERLDIGAHNHACMHMQRVDLGLVFKSFIFLQEFFFFFLDDALASGCNKRKCDRNEKLRSACQINNPTFLSQGEGQLSTSLALFIVLQFFDYSHLQILKKKKDACFAHF